MLQAVIDRFEEHKAVLLIGDDEISVAFPRQYLPGNIREGDYLRIDIAYDEMTTQLARREAEILYNKIESKNK